MWTAPDGALTVAVPPLSYSVWAPAGKIGGFEPTPRRTTQEFQMDDDLGDSSPASPGYGGRLIPNAFRTGGSIWAADGSLIRAWVYTDHTVSLDFLILAPDPATGKKSNSAAGQIASGTAGPQQAFYIEQPARNEGYYQCQARLGVAQAGSARAYIKVEYQAPRVSNLF